MCGFPLSGCGQVAEKDEVAHARARAGKPDSVLPMTRRGKLSTGISILSGRPLPAGRERQF
ncbi:hypothetical protein PAMC26577_10990 [Caballeronia sordidicola]|uniref:Uncharacterized protein n=1 Tax=Caballeronia sordidicola TaxID=196367 RepID=A0A242MYA1_CABSO|nr:hypothetical protein PAMC26577_10990 [Caballeronia sordidicola]